MKKFAIILSLFSIIVLAACGSSNAEGEQESDKKTLVMGTSADYKPYEFIDTKEGQEIVGFDIDIAKHIAKEMGYELKIEDMDFNGLIAALNSNKVDFVMAGMTPTEERKEKVQFSDIYYVAKDSLISKKESNINSVEDLKNKTIGVQLGSIQEGRAEDMQKNIEGIKLSQLDQIPQLVQELKSGRIDATIIENTVAKGYLDNNKELTSFIIDSEDEQGSAAAFPKESEIVKEFNKELQEMKESGKMDELINNWFGKGSSE
ncbi:transporter substrate-binding domain-containing protein [Pontibacillus yanchengensis]|uniref:Transporter substrate-binding domain-containing protein n=1 Tax=Pontibacillus yanchengensis TaxID=462910 RepID=A0ACC7VJK9_9BACI|nr:transporter substrate-binding domain-containing protein [Pontibacillus yanchengensis]MYL54361.1 transporter substrate-binding domain-containing protein [Pontibacillus yanchengensis]